MLNSSHIAKLQKTYRSLEQLKQFRIVTSGDVLLLAMVNIIDEDPAASNLVLANTLVTGKMMSLSQMSPVLKDLAKRGWLMSTTRPSNQNGRPVAVYKLTKKGHNILKLALELLDVATKKT